MIKAGIGSLPDERLNPHLERSAAAYQGLRESAMGRKAKFVKWHGTKARGGRVRGWYVKDDGGQSRYLSAYGFPYAKDPSREKEAIEFAHHLLERIRSEKGLPSSLYVKVRAPQVEVFDLALEDARVPLRGSELEEYLASLPEDQREATRQVISRLREWATSFHAETRGFFPSRTSASFDEIESRRAEELLTEEVGARILGRESRTKASAQKLRDVLSAYVTWKQQDHIDTAHAERMFQRFIHIVGNKPVNQLSEADFGRYVNRLLTLSNNQKATNDFFRRNCECVISVIRFVRNWGDPGTGTAFPFPKEVLDWASKYRQWKKKYHPDESNRQPVPPDVFQAMLKVADQWATMDLGAMPCETLEQRSALAHAKEKKRDGYQFKAILCLGVNCGLDPGADIACMTAQNLKEGHIDFPRRKPQRKHGRAVPRVTPLLSETQDALDEWIAYEKPQSTLFTTNHKGRHTRNSINGALGRLQSDAKTEGHYTYKHFRNCSGYAARKAGLPDWMVQAVLGHVSNTVAGKSYIEDPNPSLLRPIVKAIAAEYFPKGKRHRKRRR